MPKLVRAKRQRAALMHGEQEYLPHTLAQHSSHSASPNDMLLKTPDSEAKAKNWDEDRLGEWEWKVNGGRQWAGRQTQVDGVEQGKRGEEGKQSEREGGAGGVGGVSE